MLQDRAYNRRVTQSVVLFVCVGNSCRSPMAEAMARTLGEGRITPRSAGLAPAGFIAEPTIAALAALGYPGKGLRSKGLDEINRDDVDVVVSLCGRRGLDLVPRRREARREAWSVRDPIGEDVRVYLEVAREIEERVRQFLAEHADEELSLP